MGASNTRPAAPHLGKIAGERAFDGGCMAGRWVESGLAARSSVCLQSSKVETMVKFASRCIRTICKHCIPLRSVSFPLLRQVYGRLMGHIKSYPLIQCKCELLSTRAQSIACRVQSLKELHKGLTCMTSLAKSLFMLPDTV